MLIIEWAHEAHTKLWGLAGTDLKPAFADADKKLCGGSILGTPAAHVRGTLSKTKDFSALYSELIKNVFN